ncbi:next to BRCA1 1 protein [Elysia marginata]|uniref:Next to BRCA1 1 protein n=1 Tax=Elysia marginata TaxID=1093978 RepID=A0AAV4IBZ2_9GAST|nr:next to BRCA1 1 protein [Elysia marginata]
MDNQAIIVAVCLHGSKADEQPDPIFLRPEDESWHHFSTLMLSLYKSPPSAVYIKYLDDEKDWIDMGSDVELSEALRMTRSSGEILQVRVYPVTPDGWQDATFVTDSSSPVPSQDPYKWIPTTDLRYESFEERLVYPQPTAPTSQGVMVTSVGGTQYIDAPATQPWLVYPHPNTQQPSSQSHQGQIREPMRDEVSVSPQDSCSIVSDNNNILSGSSRPAATLSTSTPTLGSKTTLLAAATGWQSAAKLPPLEKLEFLKQLTPGSNLKSCADIVKQTDDQRAASSSPNDRSDNCDVDSLLKEFVEEGKADMPKENVWEGQSIQLAPQRQDPFEVDTANVMDQRQLLSEMDNSPTLTPTKISDGLREDNSDSNQPRETETPSAFKFAGLSPLTFVQAWPEQRKITAASSESTTVMVTHEPSEAPLVATVGNAPVTLANPKPARQGCKDKILRKGKKTETPMDTNSAKSTVKPPVPLPRALLMMEGAPCGANAVAIEMPAEAELAACGGAASVAASEETGELLAREGDAAAVSSQIKTAEERECGAGAVVSWETPEVLQVEVQAQKHRKDKSPEKEKKAKDGKSERKSSKTKTSDSDKKREDKDKKREDKDKKREDKDKKKDDKDKKREDKDKDKKKDEKKKKEEDKEKKKHSKEENRVKLSEDVESGEKVRVKGDAALQYNDFVKYMRKMKKELQASIVKDVSEETYHILQTGLFAQAQTQFNQADKEMYVEGVEHTGIYCDNCNNIIVGIRYKCGNCLDFDLCERCEAIPGLHDPTHVFLKIRHPARNAGCASSGQAVDKYCLLKENIYQVEGIKEERGHPGTPVDLSVHSTAEQECTKEPSETEKPNEADRAEKQVVGPSQEVCEREKRQNQEYRDLLARCNRESAQEKLVEGHLGGCSELLHLLASALTVVAVVAAVVTAVASSSCQHPRTARSLPFNLYRSLINKQLVNNLPLWFP